MATDAEAYIAAKGAGSWLQPSGEIRYDFFLNLGAATASLKLRAEVSANANVAPLSTLIKNGSGALCRYNHPPSPSPPPYIRITATMKSDGSSVTKTTVGASPLDFSGSITGWVEIGMIGASVMYHNYGAKNGLASSQIAATFSVQKP
jgi:hypothetical protein